MHHHLVLLFIRAGIVKMVTYTVVSKIFALLFERTSCSARESRSKKVEHFDALRVAFSKRRENGVYDMKILVLVSKTVR